MRLAEDATRKPNLPGKPTKLELKALAQKRRQRFEKVRNAEHSYARQLRKIASHVGDVVKAYAERGWVHSHLAELRATLEKYADAITPWARAIGARMLADVERRDAKAWFETAGEVGRTIRAEIVGAPTGTITRELLAEQVRLIKSLPTEAAERVHRLALEAVHTGGRADAIAREILRTGHVTASRAATIARTEVARASTTFTIARAMHLGADGYRWRTGRDSAVRPSHREMEGKFVYFSQPPTLDGMTGHAGCLPNCRCYCEIVFRD